MLSLINKRAPEGCARLLGGIWSIRQAWQSSGLCRSQLEGFLQASILQVLENDSSQIGKLLDRSRSEAGALARSTSMMDNCQLMETVHENHADHLMPQVEGISANYKQLYRRCLEDKVILCITELLNSFLVMLSERQPRCRGYQDGLQRFWVRRRGSQIPHDCTEKYPSCLNFHQSKCNQLLGRCLFRIILGMMRLLRPSGQPCLSVLLGCILKLDRLMRLQNQMTKDVIAQLQQISTQQMKIQSMRNNLAVFREAATKESDMFSQLLLVRRIPAAYRQCLAECMRR